MKYLSFDLRALALMRMAIAIVILIDLGVRLCDLEAFYANSGVLPLPLLFEKGWNDYFICFHAISGLWQIQLILFLAAAFFAVLLLIGYRSKLSTFLSWLFLLSLHNRNGFILQGGDDLLRMVLFWGMFMPWGACYSFDALADGKVLEKPNYYSVAGVAYLLQICYIYTGSALLKGPEWHTDFTALYYVYALDSINYPIVKYLYYYPELLKKLTFVAFYFELLVPILFVIPVKHQFFRFAGVLLIIVFHFCNSITLYIGMFPFIGMATSLGLLPASAMDLLDRKLKYLKEITAKVIFKMGSLVSRYLVWGKPSYQNTLILERIKIFVLIFLTAFVFDWNFSNLNFIGSKLSDQLRFIGFGLRLDQNWGMFAPGVFKDDGWFILEGETLSGEKVDLWSKNNQLNFSKPQPVISIFKNDRWRKYTEYLIMRDKTFLRGYFCNYSRRIWDEANPGKELKRLSIIFMSEFTLPDYKYAKPEKIVLWTCNK